jgi:hypothetical protein
MTRSSATDHESLEQPFDGEIVDTVTTDSPYSIPVSDGRGPRSVGFYIENGELVFYD